MNSKTTINCKMVNAAVCVCCVSRLMPQRFYLLYGVNSKTATISCRLVNGVPLMPQRFYLLCGVMPLMPQRFYLLCGVMPLMSQRFDLLCGVTSKTATISCKLVNGVPLMPQMNSREWSEQEDKLMHTLGTVWPVCMAHFACHFQHKWLAVLLRVSRVQLLRGE